MKTLCSPVISIEDVAYVLREAVAADHPSIFTVYDAFTLLQSLRVNTACVSLARANARDDFQSDTVSDERNFLRRGFLPRGTLLRRCDRKSNEVISVFDF